MTPGPCSTIFASAVSGPPRAGRQRTNWPRPGSSWSGAPTWRWHPAGREVHAVWARLVPGSEEDALAKSAYERFLVFNVEFLRICTDWQLKPGNQPNDHSDAAYDFKVLERLDRLDERAGALIDGLAEAVPRFAGYRGRLTEALDKISEDRAWLASPRCDSYHTVWMQLHEDLLSAVGVNRADEAQPRS